MEVVLLVWMLVNIVIIIGIIFVEVWMAKRKQKHIGLIFPALFFLVFILSGISYMGKDKYVITTDAGEKYSFQSEGEFNKKRESLEELEEKFLVEQTIITKEDKGVIIISGIGAFVLFAVYIYIRKKESLKKKEREMFINDL